MPLPEITLPLHLGKQATRSDPRTVMMGAFTEAAEPPPTSVDWAGNVLQWPLFGNTQYSDCTFATGGQMELCWSTSAGAKPPVVLTDQQVLAGYHDVTGFNPDDPSTDNGAIELDVLNYWRRVGIGGHKITAYMRIDDNNSTQLRTAVNLFGGVYCGFQLPLSARTQFQRHQVWQPVSGPNGRAGTWGGHAVPILGYDKRYVWFPTWGRVVRATWAFVARFLDEAYCIVAPEFFDGTGHDPQGFDEAGLMAHLRTITSA